MKTDIRINGKFLFKKSSKYFLSDIDDYKKWIEIESIPDYDNDVTEEYKKLSSKYNINKNVNFITEQSGG